jgi:hypothetical protein
LATERERLRAGVPHGRRRALIALTQVENARQLAEKRGDLALLYSRREPSLSRSDLGWSLALQLCLEDGLGNSLKALGADDAAWSDWANCLLEDSRRLGELERIIDQCEAGYLQLRTTDEWTFEAWVATRRVPAEWREREDFRWWTESLARRFASELDNLLEMRTTIRQRLRALGPVWAPAGLAFEPLVDDYYRRLGSVIVRQMANQQGYPDDTVIGGLTIDLYLQVLALMVAWLLREVDWWIARGELPPSSTLLSDGLATPHDEAKLAAVVAALLEIDQTQASQALSCLTLDRGNAAYHAAPPDGPAAPFLRLANGELLWSVAGLLTRPVFFLARELRRRYAQDYHNAAARREAVFRQDLYGLFANNRFVKSEGTFELRREGGDARTDLDALIFDRKSGTLGVFELKSQDPFARSPEERQRQRDNFYRANKQILAIWQWLQRNDATGLLIRIDPRVARTFKVQRVYLFVLGRYLAHFADGPALDRRAAWGTWPQVLRLLGERPFVPSDANPLGTLHARLTQDAPLRDPEPDPAVREIAIGPGRIRVYPSFADSNRLRTSS